MSSPEPVDSALKVFEDYLDKFEKEAQTVYDKVRVQGIQTTLRTYIGKRNKMERIKSFTINHNLLTPGFYVSREDGDIITYDLRTRKPNAGDYMSNSTMHSVEHMFATIVRNSEIADDVVYFGPMGCQTGFYLVVRKQEPKKVFEVTKKVLEEILAYNGPVYGASAIECGHYENLDLNEAHVECKKYLDVLNAQTNMEFTYPEQISGLSNFAMLKVQVNSRTRKGTEK